MHRWLLLVLALTLCACARPQFSPEEREGIVAYWREFGRYRVEAPADLEVRGHHQMRLSVAGSTWLWQYNRARRLPKNVALTGVGMASGDSEAPSWESWIDARVAKDRWQAALQAAELNGMPPPVDLEPPDPGPVPQSLVDLVGNPPPFAEVVAPRRYVVQFHEGTEISYTDNVAMRPRFAFYRFTQGVMFAGTPVRTLPTEELTELLSLAGVDESTGRVLRAVSLLEGGFDSVNTYDTGFVSVGFIQFAALGAGAGSLGSVLLRMKHDSADEFEQYFRSLGVDATDRGVLVAVDLETGAELLGPEAAQKIIDDKRLTAVFQRAGALSQSFRLAQVRVALEQYYPATDPISITTSNGVLYGQVKDVIRSEAGMATLMDRKVNTGRLDPLVDVLTRIAAERGANSLSDLAAYELDIIRQMRYRKDYLLDATLSQPQGPGK